MYHSEQWHIASDRLQRFTIVEAVILDVFSREVHGSKNYDSCVEPLEKQKQLGLEPKTSRCASDLSSSNFSVE
jgi:hypothetical protein